MPSTWSQKATNWAARTHRAEELAERNTWARQVLGFYLHVLAFQKGLYDDYVPSSPSNGTEFRAALDLDSAARCLPELADLVSKYGPPALAKEAEPLRGGSPQQNQEMIQHWLFESGNADGSSAFFARVLLQPQAERLVESGAFQPQRLAENRCPYCDSTPQVAVLRPEGDGGKRMLLCSLCNSEWEFRRILCPACGEHDHEKLPRYSAEDIAAVRVEACDTCRSYLKSVDLTVDGLAVPVVDDVATAPLDLWAAERNYRKIQVNLMGF